jgi:hypothetical protein
MIGRSVSYYRVTRQFAAGGMGMDYEACDFKPEHSFPGGF